MPRNTLLAELLQAIEEGLNRPAFLWQLAVVAAAIAGGWLVARWVRSRVDARLAAPAGHGGHAMDVLQFSIDGVRRLAFPAGAIGIILVGQWALRGAGLRDERLLRLALLLLAAMAAIRFCVYVLRRVFSRSAWLQASERTLAATIWIGVALYATGLLNDAVQLLESTELPLGRQRVSLWVILQAGASVVVTMIAALWAGSALEARLLLAQKLDSNLRYVLARFLKAVLLLVAVLVALSLVGIDLTVLSVFGGALGVGLGLGLQRIASNYVAGFIILLDRSLRIGDMITVDKHYGAVTQINTRYSVLRALDGTEAIIPNEMLVATPVTNHSYSDRRVALSLKVTVGNDSALDAALDALVAAAQAPARVLTDPPPAAYVTGFGADGVELQVNFWIRDPEEGRMNVTSDVARGVHERLRAAGIAIAYPQRELRWAAGQAAQSAADEAVPRPASAP